MDTKDFIPNKSKTISVETIKKLQPEERQGVILTPGDWRIYNEGTPEQISKPCIGVSVKGVSHEWILNQTTNERLIEELGSSDTNNWVGAVVKFLIDKRGDYEFITCTVINKAAHEEVKTVL